MVEYKVQTLERLAAHIDNLLNKDALKIYRANKRRNMPKVGREIQGLFGEDQPLIYINSGDLNVDALFFHIIDPNNITGKVRRGGREYDCNLVWSDICRNGLGPNQYEGIAREARMLILHELEREDTTGEKALSYLEAKALDPTERWRARRDWVDSLASYAHRERLTRDQAYVQFSESFLHGEKIDVEDVKSNLPTFATKDNLYSIAERIMASELKKATDIGDFSDYCIRLDLLRVFDNIGTPKALGQVRGRLNDPSEQNYVKEKAARILDIN